MKILNRIEITKSEAEALDGAVAALGNIILRYAAANGSKCDISLAVRKDLDLRGNYPWGEVTIPRWTVNPTGPHRTAIGLSLHDAFGELFAQTDGKIMRERAKLYRDAAEKVEKEAAELDAGILDP